MARPKGSKNNPNRRQLPFRQSEIERAMRAAKAQGLSVGRIDINPRTGVISVFPGQSTDTDAIKNTWDEVLTNAQDKKRTA